MGVSVFVCLHPVIGAGLHKGALAPFFVRDFPLYQAEWA